MLAYKVAVSQAGNCNCGQIKALQAHVFIDRPCFLSSVLLVVQPAVPQHVSFSQGERKRERGSEMEAVVFYNLIPEVKYL